MAKTSLTCAIVPFPHLHLHLPTPPQGAISAHNWGLPTNPSTSYLSSTKVLVVPKQGSCKEVPRKQIQQAEQKKGVLGGCACAWD